MAAQPVFATTPRLGVANVSTANTNRDGTGTIVDVLAGVAAGTRVERVVVETTGDPQDSIVTMFIHNGTAYFLYDEFDLGNPAAAATTVGSFRSERKYEDLVLPSASFKVAFAVTVALTAGVMVCWVLGADLT